MVGNALVLDANILIRAVLGKRVLSLLEAHHHSVDFFVPDTAIMEAREHLPLILARRNIEGVLAQQAIDYVMTMVAGLTADVYGTFENEARARIGQRDEDDWPVLACALALDCAIWTEDTDFFGTGVATWTSDRIERVLRRRFGD